MDETIVRLALVVSACSLVLLCGAAFFLGIFWRRILWVKSRSIDPEPGQVWNQSGVCIYVVSVTTTAKETILHLRSEENGARTEWDEDMEAWHVRVENRKLFIMPKESKIFVNTLSKENENDLSGA